MNERWMPEQLMRMMTGFATTQILLSADKLGVFDLLWDSPKDIQTIAATLGLSRGALERLLIGCCALGLMWRRGDSFGLADIARAYLVKSEPKYAGGYFAHIQRNLYPLWQHLAEAICEDKPQWDKVLGMKAEGPFASMYQDEAGLTTFLAGQFAQAYPFGLEAAERFDFSRFSHIIDLGGATGGFLAAVCEKFPSVRATIFDLRPVEKFALATLKQRGLAERVNFVAGDFFKDPLPGGGDLCVLGYILHDWTRQDGTKLLQKIFALLPDHGAVFIAETLFNAAKDGPFYPAFMNLNMLVATYGEEHTPAEYEAWLREVGFARVEYQYCDGPKSFAVGWKR